MKQQAMGSGSRAFRTKAFFILAAAMACVAGAPPLHATVVSLSAPSDEQPAGKEFQVQAVVDTVSDLYGAAADVIYDPAYLEVVDADGDPANGVQPKITEEAFLNNGGADTTILRSALQDDTAGTLVLGLTRSGPVAGIGSTSGSVLLRISFKGRQAGTGIPIGFARGALKNSAGAAIAVSAWPATQVDISGAAPALAVDCASLDFQFVAVGASSTRSCGVTNVGTASVSFTAIAITGADAPSFSQASDCSTLAPAASCSVDVSFSPAAAGPKAATLSITAGTPPLPRVDIPLTGTGRSTLQVSVDPAAAGTVTGPGFSCSDVCTKTFDTAAATFSLTADPASGYYFDHWSGASGSTRRTIQLDLSTSQSVTAHFSPGTAHELTVRKAGSGRGTVSSPEFEGIACGPDCDQESKFYVENSVVTLTAAAEAGSSFETWSGACSGSDATCTVTMTGAATVTATFTHIPVTLRVCRTCPYTSIQQAVDASGPGDDIQVQQGVYRENVVVEAAKAFTLSGGWAPSFDLQARNPALTVVDGDTDADGLGDGSVFRLHAGAGTGIEVTLENLTLRNGAATGGGGVCARAAGGTVDLRLVSDIVTLSSADSGGGVLAASSANGNLTLTAENCVIAGNTASEGGGVGISSSGAGARTDATLVNCTVYGNIAGSRGGGIFGGSADAGSTTITALNDIVWNNADTDLFLSQQDASTTAAASYSDLGTVVAGAAAFTADHTLDADPVLVNPALGNFRLNADSPCINAGDAAGAAATDYEGAPRPVDGAVDIGADEYTAVSYAQMKLLSLRGGEIIPAGDSYNITWGAPDGVPSFTVRYTLDGETWKSLPTIHDPAVRHVSWKAAPTPTANLSRCRVEVNGAASPRPFSIEVVRLLSPNGAEVFHAGEQVPIVWRTTSTPRNPVHAVKLYYAPAATPSWWQIQPGPPTGENPGFLLWNIPAPRLGAAYGKVKVELFDVFGRSLGEDVSDGFFTVRR